MLRVAVFAQSRENCHHPDITLYQQLTLVIYSNQMAMNLDTKSLDKSFQDIAHLKRNTSSVIDALERLPKQDRYEAEAAITHCLLNASQDYDELLVDWHTYITRHQNYLAAGVTARDAKNDIKTLTSKVNAIKSDRDRTREHWSALVNAWGADIADAIIAEPCATEYYLREVKKAATTGESYWSLRRRANRLTVKRLREVQSGRTRDRGYNKQIHNKPAEWKAAAAGEGIVQGEHPEHIPPEWLHELDLHVDSFGILQEGALASSSRRPEVESPSPSRRLGGKDAALPHDQGSRGRVQIPLTIALPFKDTPSSPQSSAPSPSTLGSPARSLSWDDVANKDPLVDTVVRVC